MYNVLHVIGHIGRGGDTTVVLDVMKNMDCSKFHFDFITHKGAKEEIVKERFIRLLLPFATKLAKGRTIDNLRARINDALLSRPKPNRIK